MDKKKQSANQAKASLRFPPFKPYVKKEGSTLEYGDYYQAKFKLPFAKDQRFIRVWLPPEYEAMPDKRFPVLYMSDGQNLVDRALSAYGDWHLDKAVHKLSEEGLLPPILVGIDCPKSPMQRSNELNPPFPVQPSILRAHGPNSPIADQYIDFVADTLRPLINSLFRTDTRKEATGIGGSSMGGIMAFYAFFRRNDVFGFSMSFSIPAFFYGPKRWQELVESWGIDPAEHGKLAIFVGGYDFEKRFEAGCVSTVKLLRKAGYGKDKLEFFHDSALPHHEESWATYAVPSLRFWLKDLD